MGILETMELCAHKRQLLNRNKYLKQYHHYFKVGILEAIRPCGNYLYLVEILEIIERHANNRLLLLLKGIVT